MPARTPRQSTVSLISLGCPRTLVDSERYLGKLVQAGFAVVDHAEHADVAVINTCSFIQESVQESIDTILDAVALKKRGKLKAVIVAGCLVQRYQQGLIKELPEVDGFVGVDGFGDIDAVVQQALRGSPTTFVRPRPRLMQSGQPLRVPLTASHYAYLKISEGCLKGCSFCIIPKIKGPLASRPLEALVEEATRLVEERGVKELIVVGQDTSDYGVDLYGRSKTPELLQALGKLPGVRWIRLLYYHPRGMSQALLETIRDVPTVCKYLDMAIEHADDAVLSRMNRRISQARLRQLIDDLRTTIPGITLRTSVIVGFPGETAAAFETLLRFIQDIRFERLGAFRYSNEEGSAAFRYPDQVREEYGRNKEEIQIINGDKGWTVDINGAKPLTDEEMKTYRESQSMRAFHVLRFRLGEEGSLVETVGRDFWENREVDVVRFVDGENRAVTFWLDRGTHLPARAVRVFRNPQTRERIEETELFSNYFTRNGIASPRRMVRERNGTRIFEAVIQEVQYNLPFQDSLFLPPSR